MKIPIARRNQAHAGVCAVHDGRFDSRGHGEIASLVFGSVAARVLARSTVPVFLSR
jgi:nucleotide-binding universal stress UspA family protein